MKRLFTTMAAVITIVLLAGCTPGTPAQSAGNDASSATPAAKPSPATTIADFTITDLNGNEFDTAALRGKILVINFWATWCGPCRAEMPDIERVYKQMGDDVAFIAIDVPEEGMTPETMEAFLSESGFTFPVALDDAQNSIADTYRVEAIPTTLFVDPAGALYYKQVGAFPNGEAILSKIEEIRSSK